MEIAVVLNTHGKPEATLDTAGSVLLHAGERCLLVVDGAGWSQFDQGKTPIPLLKGFDHNHKKAPYRNVALGLWACYRRWPNCDWYCYMEYDCLFASRAFQEDLLRAGREGVWCVGFDLRENQGQVKLELVERMLKNEFQEIVYMLGACVFYHRKFMERAAELDFFDKFLFMTNPFEKGYFPGYTAWDVMEHLMPTLARHWGGGLRQLSQWSEVAGRWVAGNERRYPVRWRPDIESIADCLGASIVHPLKDYNNPVREHFRLKRTNS